MGKNTNNIETFFEELSVLTPREREIFDMLLDGAIPKEIAHSLNVSYNTVKTHQMRLYQKLGVHTIRDMVSKFNAPHLNAFLGQMDANKQGVRAFFTRWILNIDNLGSFLDVSEKVEQIGEQYFPTITISGKLLPINHVFAGTYGIPDTSTHDAMKKADRLSFKVLGDGNSYVVMIPTADTRLKSDYNHYRKLITTKNGEIETININIEELAQSPFWGNPVPFIKNNVEFFQIHAYATREFNLKFWDVRFYAD